MYDPTRSSPFSPPLPSLNPSLLIGQTPGDATPLCSTSNEPQTCLVEDVRLAFDWWAGAESSRSPVAERLALSSLPKLNKRSFL